MTLKARFLAIFSAFVFTALAVFSAINFVLERRALLQTQRQDLFAALDKAETACRRAAEPADLLAALFDLQELTRGEAIRHAYCLDDGGRVRVDSDQRRVGALAPSTEMAQRRGRFFERRYDEPNGSTLWEISRPVWLAGRPAGVAVVAASETYLRRQLNHKLLAILQRIALVFLLTLALALLAANFVAESLAGPIRRLSAGAQEIGKGKWDVRVNERRDDELGELAREFNTMAQKLGELDELKDSFLSRITHDLRNPLGAMLGFVEMMALGMQGPVSDKHQRTLGIVLTNGRYLADLINNILDITKLEAGKMEFARARVELRKSVEPVVELMAAKAEEFKVTLDASGVQPHIEVTADEQALRRVLLNLISNALKFTPEGGTVFVEHARLPTGEHRITVRDTGIGIPADKLGTLFQKFSVISETHGVVRSAKGTGLGLVICKEIVEGHGGKIWVESVYRKGTSFHFTLPDVAAPAPYGPLPAKA